MQYLRKGDVSKIMKKQIKLVQYEDMSSNEIRKNKI